LPDFLHLVDKLGQAFLSQAVGHLQLVEQRLALRIALPPSSHQVAQELYIGAHLPQLVAQMPVALRVRHLAGNGRFRLGHVATRGQKAKAFVRVALIGRGVGVDKVPARHTFLAVEARPAAVADGAFEQGGTRIALLLALRNTTKRMNLLLRCVTSKVASTYKNLGRQKLLLTPEINPDPE
jgi:hypothetical protein